MVLCLDASDETMKQRLQERAQSADGADQANAEAAIAQSLDDFHKNQPAIADHYEKQGKMHKVDANQPADDVYGEIKKIFEQETGIGEDETNEDGSKQNLAVLS